MRDVPLAPSSSLQATPSSLRVAPVGVALLASVSGCAFDDPPPEPPPDPVPSTIAFSKDGDGTGEMRTLPGGLICDVDCDADAFTFEDTDVVTVVVQPARDAMFRSLVCTPSLEDVTPQRADALDDGGEARLSLATIVDGDGVDWTCTATFSQVQTLQVLLPGDGSGHVTGSLSAVVGADEPRRVDCPDDCIGAYFFGETETLTAVADEGSVFVGWRFCGEGTAPVTLVMDRDVNCDAVFEPAP
jgi:hypothetical protein